MTDPPSSEKSPKRIKPSWTPISPPANHARRGIRGTEDCVGAYWKCLESRFFLMIHLNQTSTRKYSRVLNPANSLNHQKNQLRLNSSGWKLRAIRNYYRFSVRHAVCRLYRAQAVRLETTFSKKPIYRILAFQQKTPSGTGGSSTAPAGVMQQDQTMGSEEKSGASSR